MPQSIKESAVIMLDTEQSFMIKIIQEAIGTTVDLDTAVALTYILNNYLIHVSETCYTGNKDFGTPIEMTLRYSCEIVCQLQIRETPLVITNYIAWMTVWNGRYLQIYDTKEFKELVHKILHLLELHHCVNKIEEYPP